MALKQHKDLAEMVRQQTLNAEKYVLPFIAQTKDLQEGTTVLEIGCAEGGVLKPFIDKGCKAVGVDLDSPRVINAGKIFKQDVDEGKVIFLSKNIFDNDFFETYQHHFDVIILKDVIEHIHEQETFIPYLKMLLKPKGQVFFGFPPWYMPFGGHQQLCENKFVSMLPYYHLLPKAMYQTILKLAGESSGKIDGLLEIKDTGISIERFEKIVHNSHYNIVNKQWFLINPIYEFKFGLQPRKQNWLFGAIPYVRNFFTTCAYYTIQA